MTRIVLNEVSLNLSKFIKEILPEKLDIGMERACQCVEIKAKDSCSVDDGTLRASISHEIVSGKGEGIVGTNVEYAPYVHEGTGIHAKNGNGRQTPWRYKDAQGKWHTTQGQKPNPFLQDALDEEISRLPSFFEGLI